MMVNNDIPNSLRSQAVYAKALRPLLPPEAFLTDPSKLVILAINLGILCLGWTLGRQLDHWPNSLLWVYIPLAVAMGNSVLVLGFGAHEILHNGVIRRPKWTRLAGFLCFALYGMPPTLWKVLHNRLHHNHTNSVRDPDRNYRYQQPNCWGKWLTDVVTPSVGKPRIVLPLLLPLDWVTYASRNLASVLVFNGDSSTVAPAAFKVKLADRLTILAEWLLMLSIHFGVIAYLQFQPVQILLAYVLPVALGYSGVMVYILTNHFFCPMTAVNDPLANSISVRVHPVLDLLHFNFSYHAEHHIFPGLNSDYYPQVRELLQQHFPERMGYVLPLGEAWRRLLNTPNLYLDDTTLTNWPGTLAMPCPGPEGTAAKSMLDKAESVL